MRHIDDKGDAEAAAETIPEGSLFWAIVLAPD
jgi:hypothetical protein